MAEFYINTEELRMHIPELQVGDKVYLSGTVYTARDAAHLRLCSLIAEGKALPFDIDGAVIYYAGPTPTKENGQIGSFGPTTSSRMDAFAPTLLDRGLSAMIGKGDRSPEVIESVSKNRAVYFCAGGGFGALISESIRTVEEIAFPELGCESIKRLEVRDFPLITAIDCKGNSIFQRNG